MQVDQNRQTSTGVEGLLCAGHLAGPSRGRLGRQEACPEAVLVARRPVLSGSRRTQGRLVRQGDRPCPEPVLGARRPVWRPVGGCLESQQARPEAVLGARRPKTSVLPTVRAKTSVLPTVRAKTSVLRRRQGDQAAGRSGGREARRQEAPPAKLPRR